MAKKKQQAGLGGGALILLLLLYLVVQYFQRQQEAPPPAAGDGYLFCFWNVENFFDDQPNNWSSDADQPYDEWFASDPEALKLKLKHLCDVILAMNDGRGPDILALAEVESTQRAPELLKEALNARIADAGFHYKNVLIEEVHVGRNISPVLITRLPVKADRTRKLDGRMRIMEAHVEADGHDLTVIVSHWTSRVSDETGERRAVYADKIYGRFRQMYQANPDVAFLVCGDFNDNPDDPSVTEHLHATGDLNAQAPAGGPPLLFNLMAGAYGKREGSLFYRGNPFVFDQIVVSPGLLRGGQGWQCVPSSAQIVTGVMADKNGRPNRFGNRKDRSPRGYADHFPVAVRLKVVKGS